MCPRRPLNKISVIFGAADQRALAAAERLNEQGYRVSAMAVGTEEGAPLPDAVREIFWEGICVTVAHQECRMKGEPGFVDAQGTPNPNYETTEDRIAAFADLGAKVIASHTQRTSS